MRPSETTSPATVQQPGRSRPPPESCPSCGAARAVAGEVASAHRTSEGLVIWVRCVCGAIELRRERSGAWEVLGRGRSPRLPRPDTGRPPWTPGS